MECMCVPDPDSNKIYMECIRKKGGILKAKCVLCYHMEKNTLMRK